MKSIKFLCSICVLFILALSSCSDKLDVDQYRGFVAEPEVEASIFYVEVPERVINNLPPEQNFFSRNFNFDAFSADFFAERVIDGTVTYVLENTTSKELDILVEFLDEDGNVLDTQPFTIGDAPEPIQEVEVPYGGAGKSIDIIRNLSSIRVSAENRGGTATTSTFPDPKVTLKSKGRFRLKLK